MEDDAEDRAFDMSPLGQMVARKMNQVRLNEQKLESLQPDKFLTPILKPDDEYRSFTKQPASLRAEDLKAANHDIREDIMRETDRHLAQVDPVERKRIRELVLKRISQAKDKGADDRESLRRQQKDINLSQDVAASIIYSGTFLPESEQLDSNSQSAIQSPEPEPLTQEPTDNSDRSQKLADFSDNRDMLIRRQKDNDIDR